MVAMATSSDTATSVSTGTTPSTSHQSFEPGDALLSHPKYLAERYSVKATWRLTSSTRPNTASCTTMPATLCPGQQFQPTALPDASSTRVRDAWAPACDPGPAAATSNNATHTRRRLRGEKSGPGSGRGRAGLDELQGIAQECLICRRCTEGSRHTPSCSWRSLAAKLDSVVYAMLSHNTSL